jgi:hypothetical protein
MLQKSHASKEPAYFLVVFIDGSNIVYRDAKLAATPARAGKPVRIGIPANLDLKVGAVSTATLNPPISSAQ